MIKNPFNKTPVESKEIEWLSLDDYVKGDAAEVLYARIHGAGFGGITGNDLIVTDRNKKPTTSDIVLILVGTTYAIKYFSEVQKAVKPLRLAARNGQKVADNKQNKSNSTPIEVIGVVTHVLKTLEAQNEKQ